MEMNNRLWNLCDALVKELASDCNVNELRKTLSYLSMYLDDTNRFFKYVTAVAQLGKGEVLRHRRNQKKALDRLRGLSGQELQLVIGFAVWELKGLRG